MIAFIIVSIVLVYLAFGVGSAKFFYVFDVNGFRRESSSDRSIITAVVLIWPLMWLFVGGYFAIDFVDRWVRR